MERNKITDNKDQVNLIKIISNHINYLENDILVFENILDEIDNNKIADNFLENLRNEEIKDAPLLQNIENSYFYYLKNQEEETDKINFIVHYENEKVKRKLYEAQKQLEDFRYQVNLANNEINEVTKQKKFLEEKYADLESKLHNKNLFNLNDTENHSTNKGDYSMKKLVHAQKKEKEKRFRYLKNEICRQEKLLLENKKKLEEREKKALYLNNENHHLRESIKQKSLIIEHLYIDANNTNMTRQNINESSVTSRTPNNLNIINQERHVNQEFDAKSSNSNFSTNATANKKKGFVGFFQKIFK